MTDGTNYEVVWCHKGIMYVWSYTKKGTDVDPMDLPEAVTKVLDFIDGLNKEIPVMVYRLKSPNDGGYCSHCNARRKPHLFANASKWLKKKGMKP